MVLELGNYIADRARIAKGGDTATEGWWCGDTAAAQAKLPGMQRYAAAVAGLADAREVLVAARAKFTEVRT